MAGSLFAIATAFVLARAWNDNCLESLAVGDTDARSRRHDQLKEIAHARHAGNDPGRLAQLESRVFTSFTLRAGALLLIVISAVDLARLYQAGRWLFDADGHLRLIDFGFLWAGGRLALAGQALACFDDGAFAAAQQSLVGAPGPGETWFHWVHPPILFFIALPLALLPYLPAFIAWCLASGALYLAAVGAILRRRWAILLALAPSAVGVNLLLGQTAFLSAAILGLALAAMKRRPFLGGLILSLLAFKPQLCLLLPVVLIVAARWRIVAGAALGLGLLVAASLAAFGAEAWLAFFHSLALRNPQDLTADQGAWVTLQTPFGLLSWLGADYRIAWAGQIGVLAAALAIACVVWRRDLPHELKAAALVLACLLGTPYLLAYDFVIAVVPAAFLIRLGLDLGFLPGERLMLLASFLLLLAFVFPIGSIALALLMILVLRRALRTGAIEIR
jgi:glycosyl transferase family 87